MNARVNTPGVKSISRIPVDLSFDFVSILAACGKHKAKYIMDLHKLPKGKMEKCNSPCILSYLAREFPLFNRCAFHMSHLVERSRGLIQQQVQ